MPKTSTPRGKKKTDWENLVDNQILRGDTFCISYNPDTGKSGEGMGSVITDIGNALGGLIEKPTLVDGEETALVKVCKGGKNMFYILEGDWRKEYEELFPKGFGACKKFYDSKKEEAGSNWSDD